MDSAWSDPQFYVVTAAAGWGLWRILRPFLSAARKPEAGCSACSSCAPRASTGGRADAGSRSAERPLVVLGPRRR